MIRHRTVRLLCSIFIVSLSFLWISCSRQVDQSDINGNCLPEIDQWVLKNNPLSKCQMTTTPGKGGALPTLKVSYEKPHRYLDLSPEYAYVVEYTPKTPFDLSSKTRFTCTFQSTAGHGYYSGRWLLRLIDDNEKKVDYVIHQEAWRAREPVFVERALNGIPKDFNLKAVQHIEIIGYTSVQKQTSYEVFSGIVFDDEPLGQEDRLRSQKWQALREKLPQSKSFLIHPVSTSHKLLRDEWDNAWSNNNQTQTITLNAAKNGHDDHQIAILPLGESMEDINISVSTLVAQNGQKIAPSQIKLYEVMQVPTLPKGRDEIYKGWLPDILKPLKNYTIGIDPRMTSVLWIEAKIPENAADGIYTGNLTLSRNDKIKTISLKLRVFDFVLPRRPSFRTIFWLFPRKQGEYMGINGKDLQFRDFKPCVDLALEHRITPISTDWNLEEFQKQPDGSYKLNISRWKEYYDYVMACGGNSVHLGDTHFFGRRAIFGFPGIEPEDRPKNIGWEIAPQRKERLRVDMDAVNDYAKQKGWSDYCYLQPWDEATPEALEKILPGLYEVIEEVSPDTVMLHTMHLPKELSKYIDAPCPTIPVLDKPADGGRKHVAKTHAEGKQQWFYSCVSYGITIPEEAVRDRLIPLYGFNSGADGYLFWALNYTIPQKGFPKEPLDIYRTNRGPGGFGIGDGVMMYPTPSGQILPSTRLKMFRAGMEDYEFLKRLSDLYEQNKDNLTEADSKAIEKLLCLDDLLFYAGWDDPNKVDDRRIECGCWIEKLSKM